MPDRAPPRFDPPRHDALKARHRSLRENHPPELSLRLHRALSWLKRAEAETEDVDARFVFLWIAFNAAYADDPDDPAAHRGDRGAFMAFLARLVEADGAGRIQAVLMERFPHEIRLLFDNRYVFGPFWDWHNGRGGAWETRFEAHRREALRALGAGEVRRTLSLLFETLYVLRNQLLHGGATWGSSVNRGQVRDGARILGALTPLFIEVMMEAPDRDWGRPHYPVVPGD